MSDPSTPAASHDGSYCPRCTSKFTCAVEAGGTSCWCASHPRVLPVPSTAGRCLCPDCLASMIEKATRAAGPQNIERK